MSEHDDFVRRTLGAAPVPAISTQELLATATQDGRRTVRRHQGMALGAALALVSVLGVSLALAAPGSERAESPLIAEKPSASPTPTPTPTDGRRTPKGGSLHADILEPLTDREVVAVSPSPQAGAALQLPDGIPDELSEYLRRDPLSSQTALDADFVSISFEWGLEGVTPEDAEMLSDPAFDGFHGDVRAEPLPDDLMKHCRTEHESRRPAYAPGRCMPGKDGSVIAEIDHLWEDISTHVRAVIVYHPDNWVQRTEVRTGSIGTTPELTGKLTVADLRRFTLKGNWWT